MPLSQPRHTPTRLGLYNQSITNIFVLVPVRTHPVLLSRKYVSPCAEVVDACIQLGRTTCPEGPIFPVVQTRRVPLSKESLSTLSPLPARMHVDLFTTLKYCEAHQVWLG